MAMESSEFQESPITNTRIWTSWALTYKPTSRNTQRASEAVKLLGFVHGHKNLQTSSLRNIGTTLLNFARVELWATFEKYAMASGAVKKKVEFLIATEPLELESSQILKRTRLTFVRIAIWSTFEKCAACQCVCENTPICSSPLKPSNFKTHKFSKGKVLISCALTYGPPSRNMQLASGPVKVRRMCAWPWNPSNCEPLKFWNRRVEIVWALALGPPSKNMEQASGVSRFRRFLSWEGGRCFGAVPLSRNGVERIRPPAFSERHS